MFVRLEDEYDQENYQDDEKDCADAYVHSFPLSSANSYPGGDAGKPSSFRAAR